MSWSAALALVFAIALGLGAFCWIVSAWHARRYIRIPPRIRTGSWMRDLK